MQKSVIVSHGKKVFLLYRKKDIGYKSFAVAVSDDGLHFQDTSALAEIYNVHGLRQNLNECDTFHVTSYKDVFIMTYNRTTRLGKNTLNIATGHTVNYWRTRGYFDDVDHSGAVVETPTEVRKYLMYFGDKHIYLAWSKNLHTWYPSSKPVLEPRPGYFDQYPLEVARAKIVKKGVELTYYTKRKKGRRIIYGIGAALMSRSLPSRCLWRSEGPLWEEPESWRAVKPIGIADVHGEALYYWQDSSGRLFVSRCVPGEQLKELAVEHGLRIERHQGNPIIRPISHHEWESKATFNPAAVYDNGRVHLMYRAIGDNDVSVLGYASSADGLHFDERLREPAYTPRHEFEGLNVQRGGFPNQYSSGGEWGGCEDPRLTRMGDSFYMTYVAYNGRNYPRVALTSIAVNDFLAHRWRWKKPALLSSAHEVHKNWVLFPSKIKNKFALLHSISPTILIDYFDSLNDLEYARRRIQSGYGRADRIRGWDNWTRGAAAPPIHVDSGWLLFYHAMDVRDPNRYKLGAMILDESDPAKIVCRSKMPVLAPDAPYENNGLKSGVIYSCGAVVKGEDLLIYYGGADTVTCVARAPIKDFIKKLFMHREPTFERATVTA